MNPFFLRAGTSGQLVQPTGPGQVLLSDDTGHFNVADLPIPYDAVIRTTEDLLAVCDPEGSDYRLRAGRYQFAALVALPPGASLLGPLAGDCSLDGAGIGVGVSGDTYPVFDASGSGSLSLSSMRFESDNGVGVALTLGVLGAARASVARCRVVGQVRLSGDAFGHAVFVDCVWEQLCIVDDQVHVSLVACETDAINITADAAAVVTLSQCVMNGNLSVATGQCLASSSRFMGTIFVPLQLVGTTVEFRGCQFFGTLTLQGDIHSFVDCAFQAPVILQFGANSFVSCVFATPGEIAIGIDWRNNDINEPRPLYVRGCRFVAGQSAIEVLFGPGFGGNAVRVRAHVTDCYITSGLTRGFDWPSGVQVGCVFTGIATEIPRANSYVGFTQADCIRRATASGTGLDPETPLVP